MAVKEIRLDRFQPRPYQIPIADAIEKGYKKIIAVLPRRAGKDLAAWNAVIRKAIEKKIVVWYVLPEYSQAKKAIYDGMTYDGHGYVDYYIPQELIAAKNSQELKITLINGSIIQLVGSNKYDSLRGAGPSIVVFSEAAFQDAGAQTAILPMLAAAEGGGICIYVTTPNGKGWFWDLWCQAQKEKGWFTYLKTVEDTKHIPVEEIENLERSGQMSYELIQQEFYCSFNRGVEGSVYGRILQEMRNKKQIGQVPYDPDYPVFTSWDLGIKDKTVICFFQVIDRVVHFIDYYAASDMPQSHFAKILKDKPYSYAQHFMPHDVFVREQTTAITRYERWVNLGIEPTKAGGKGKLSIEDGIEATKAALARTWIDEIACRDLIKAMENYHYEYDAKRNVYNESKPVHDMWSHACFVGDTLVATDQGEVPIKKIQIGMKVKTPFGYRTVQAVHQRTSHNLIDIHINNKTITCTPDHNIFTHRGLIRADALRYNDILEPNSKLQGYLWSKIYGLCGEAFATKGFKKSYLSLKMKTTSILMDMLIGGMDIITERGPEPDQLRLCTEQFGYIAMVPSQKVGISTILTETIETMTYPIYNACQQVITSNCMEMIQKDGRNQNDAKKLYDRSMQRQLNGTDHLKEENGTENMRQNLCRYVLGKNIQKLVIFANRVLMVNKHGRGFVQTNVKPDIGSNINLISSLRIVLFVRILSIATNILARKHAVKSVQKYQRANPVTVYDITVETDNCYYANGYLVSNCDSLRYALTSLGSIHHRDSTPEELEQRYREAMYGPQRSPLPVQFMEPKKPNGNIIR